VADQQCIRRTFMEGNFVCRPFLMPELSVHNDRSINAELRIA
jgi:hypothetical protein